MLAVKPQNVETLATQIKTPVYGVILSIIAGCTVKSIKRLFGDIAVVRCMPNTPAAVRSVLIAMFCIAECCCAGVARNDCLVYISRVQRSGHREG